MAISRFSTYNFVSFKWLLLLTTVVLFVFATLNYLKDITLLAIIEYIASVISFVSFYYFDKYVNDNNISKLSFVFSNLVLLLLVYIATVNNVSITTYLWLSIIPFAAYLLNSVMWGFLLTFTYLTITSITLFLNFQDYLDYLSVDAAFNLVGSVITLWVLTHSYAISNINAKNRLIAIATKDSLTGLNNRHAFYDFFNLNKNKEKSLMIIDLDFFKKINDKYGHDGGDYILQTVAQIFNQQVKNDKCVFRLGGEEFAILLPDIELAKAVKIAHKINQAVKEYEFIYHNQYIQVTASIGVAYSDSSDDDLNILMRRADTCLYQAKNNGRDCVIIDENPLS